MYNPPFRVTAEAKRFIELINDLLANFTKDIQPVFKPILRKSSRIKSIYSSCAIEANSLSLDETKDIINGHSVIGPKKDIIEIKNAQNAYEFAEKINPFNEQNILEAHRILTNDLLFDAGQYRKHNEGVFDGDKCIFVAPPFNQVKDLMKDLFAWLNEAKYLYTPLIYANVFHYELVFIHPFSDGNGRIARLWNSLLLATLSKEFLLIPIESQIKLNQEDYYKAINVSNTQGESTKFLEFMLKMIYLSLKDVLKEISKIEINPLIKLLDNMPLNKEMSIEEIKSKMNLKSNYGLRKGYLSKAIKEGYVKLKFPDKVTSRYQKYIKVKDYKD